MRRISVGTPGDIRGAPFDVVAVKTTPSRSSGKPLEELVVISLLPMHDALLLQRALEEGVVRVYDEHDDDQERHYSRYHVGTYITSERAAHDARAFEIQLVEIEELRLTGLSIAGIDFPAPYRYTEEFRGVGLEIVARIKVNVDELDRLYELSITDPHEVVRHGVTEESRLMSLLIDCANWWSSRATHMRERAAIPNGFWSPSTRRSTNSGFAPTHRRARIWPRSAQTASSSTCRRRTTVAGSPKRAACSRG